MGRYSFSSKTEADSLKKIEIYWLHKHGLLKPGWWYRKGITWTRPDGSKNDITLEISTVTNDLYIRPIYIQTDRETGEKKSFDYKIPLITSPCNLGGIRYWFKCPMSKNGVSCNRRVATLYKDGDYFACRHCYDLTYSCKKQNYRGYVSLLGKLLNQERKMFELKDSIKRRAYAGKPTKKFAKFMRLARQQPEDLHGLINKSLFRS